MSYKIVVDSCGELTEEMKADGHFQTVSLELDVDDKHYVDDDSFDQIDFLQSVKMSPNSPKSTCPSPEKYMEAYNCDADHVYAVTLSAELSGSYNSAELGKNLCIEEYGERPIHVFNSKSASIGETLIGLKIQECEEAGMDFEQVIETVDAYIEEQHTYFVLETLETLRKNGRLSNLKAFVVSALNIKPVMGSTPEGKIQQLDQARGMGKALDKMADEVMKDVVRPEEKVIAISHCNNEKRGELMREKLLAKGKFKDVILVNTRGISSMYACDGGVIVVV